MCVNVEALTGADFDGVKAMHRLFQVFRQYSGELFEYKDKEGNQQIGVSFGGLALMSSWYERYEKYQKELKAIEKIKDTSEKGNALITAEDDFNLCGLIFIRNQNLGLIYYRLKNIMMCTVSAEVMH